MASAVETTVEKQRLLALVPRLAGHTVLVLGDLFLDEYLIGRAERLSREAPIPVLALQRRMHLPGGAANPARNVTALGSQAYSVGIVGDDPEAKHLVAALQHAEIRTAGVAVDPGRPTTLKTRILAESTFAFPQQIARLDRQVRQPVGGDVERALIRHLETLVPRSDAMLISDYKSGVVTPQTIETARALARRHGKLLTVDSQGDLYQFSGFDLVRAHRRDTEACLGRPLSHETDFEKAGAQLVDDLAAQAVVISRGAEGMSLSTPEGYWHIPAANRSEVFDVTGAGDTVIAVLTLALIAGATPLEAAWLASYAAGLVIRRLGNATPTPDELAWAVRNW